MIPELSKENISTIDSYQGKEYNYIIFSCVRYYGSSKFVDDWRRINVAVSRAKKQIYVIGSGHYIMNETINLKALLTFDKKNYKHPASDMEYHFKCKKWNFDGKSIK